METTYNRANNPQSISPSNRGTPPKAAASPFADLAQASLIPTGSSPTENVLGTNRFSPAGVNAAPSAALDAAATPSAESVDLGTEEWEQLQLQKAIKALKEKYQRLATESGGSITDPYWQNQLDVAVDSAYDDIRSQSSSDRATREESQKNRDLQASEGALDRAAQLKAAEDARKAQEKAALYGGLGHVGMTALLTPRGGVESKIIGQTVKDIDGVKVLVPQYSDAKPATTPLGDFSRASWEGFKSGFSPLKIVSTDPSKAPGDAGFSTTSNALSRYLAPTAAGTGVGMLLNRKGNAFAQIGSGFLGSGLNNIANAKASPWGNLVTSAGMAWANPFSKSSWGKHTAGTLTKGLGPQILSRILGI